jgi:hypothetical protein
MPTIANGRTVDVLLPSQKGSFLIVFSMQIVPLCVAALMVIFVEFRAKCFKKFIGKVTNINSVVRRRPIARRV